MHILLENDWSLNQQKKVNNYELGMPCLKNLYFSFWTKLELLNVLKFSTFQFGQIEVLQYLHFIVYMHAKKLEKNNIKIVECYGMRVITMIRVTCNRKS